MNVLSLFDGMSCGMVALERAGVVVGNYYASEIDEYAIKISKKNHPPISHLGDITSWRDWGLEWGNIDLILAGSPCHGFSRVGKQLAFDDHRSKLYFVFEDILNEVKKHNQNVKFILENVVMNKDSKCVISERLGVQPMLLNSALVSAQNRPRLYWTNIQVENNLPDYGIGLFDILEPNVEEKYKIVGGRLRWLETYGEEKESKGYVAFNPPKAKCLTVRGEPSWNTTYVLTDSGGAYLKKGFPENGLADVSVRKLTEVECERLQTLPDNYTAGVSKSQRYKMLGNGWTVDVISHILRSL